MQKTQCCIAKEIVMKINSKLIHTIGSPDHMTGSIVPPIHLSTIFAMENPSSNDGFQYGRVNNPTRQILEKTIAEMEGGKFAAVFSSGSAAMTTLLAMLKTGDRVLFHKQIYEGTSRLVKNVFSNFGIQCDFADMTNIESFKKSFTSQTKAVLLESPTNPLLITLDIRMINNISHQHGTFVIVDNTFATPILQRPLILGTDVVVESLTKSINGHSDALGGALCTNNKKLFEKIKFLQHTIGAVLSPFECFLILRGMKTLPIRILQQQKSAIAVANFLLHHPKIKQVFFPGFQRTDFMKKQMKGPGFMISFILKGYKGKPLRFIKSLKFITIAHSLGGTETLIQQPTKMMDLSMTKKQQKELKLTDSFFRLSLGLEDMEDILADLNQALKAT
jgi:cystathionine gamma-lyase